MRFVVLVTVLLFAVEVRSAADDRKTNVILIVADDLGWADLGCYGSKFHKTPNLDQLAADGIRFTDAYAACPVCSPTRAALMTGKWPARLHLTDWLPGRVDRPDQPLLRPQLLQHLPLAETTIAEMLRNAGYKTGHIGKWHLGGEGFEPQRQGFELNVAGDHTGTPLSYFAPFKGRARGAAERFMPGLEEARDGEYLTDRLTAEAERFIESNRDQPFFLYLPHYAVHTPLRAKQNLIEKYPQPMKLGDQSNAIYAAMLESLDEGVGRIRKKLAELSLSDSTMIVFTSDNGGLATLEGPNTPATINAPLREGKGYLYEGGIRVPLIAVSPGEIAPGSTTSTPVVSHDLFPTILATCAVTTESTHDGIDLTPLLRKQAPLQRDALYWHYPHYSNQGGRPGGAIRDGDLKLVEFYENNRRELYDVKADIRESRNLATERPEDVKRLADKLEKWRQQIGAQPMRRNPDFVPNPQSEDGTITLAARTAEVHGVQLRYEPLPHKNTLGFWTHVTDWASWEFTVTKPGKFQVVVHQGCGTGQGGSEIEFAVNEQVLPLTVLDTGHFQNFKAREVGVIQLDTAGRFQLSVKAKTKAKAAIVDIREVTLKPLRE